MKLVIGGAYQGKLAFAQSLSGAGSEAVTADGESASRQELEQADVINHFHLYIRRALQEGLSQEDLLEWTDQIIKKKPDLIIVSTELGYGVVPVDAFDRRWRECVGRVCTGIAAQADEVYRVVCGIGTRIK